jgi:hypothetical protein
MVLEQILECQAGINHSEIFGTIFEGGHIPVGKRKAQGDHLYSQGDETHANPFVFEKTHLFRKLFYSKLDC